VKRKESDAEQTDRRRPLWDATDSALRIEAVSYLVLLARLHHGLPVERPFDNSSTMTPGERLRRRERDRGERALQGRWCGTNERLSASPSSRRPMYPAYERIRAWGE
jgi:hypothetical protein